MKYGNNTTMRSKKTLLIPTLLEPKKLAFVFISLAILIISPSAIIALVVGAVFGLTLTNPLPKITNKWIPILLGLSIIGLGANINLSIISGLSITQIGIITGSIAFILTVGSILGRAFGVDKKLFLLISVGTAICGGSAIAAVIPTLNPKKKDITYALTTVFILNAIALCIFPLIGQLIELSSYQFGLWAALAIHDTSSVVGATMQFSQEALEIGTTIKLTRALFIIPVTLVISMVNRKDTDGAATSKLSCPWFIIGFVAMIAITWYFPQLKPLGEIIGGYSKQGLVFILFLIGSMISKDMIKNLDTKAFLFAISLWLISALTILGIILI
ncbi:putative sulfate exporter family transporter [Candidatus Marinamargulisbacteria bacterium SCGC AAA071-K20]|nr:putative sulfate exporter family transporter [Candidatus Marinamargulisbacteria bacterium SCGC AAA071-K20]